MYKEMRTHPSSAATRRNRRHRARFPSHLTNSTMNENMWLKHYCVPNSTSPEPFPSQPATNVKRSPKTTSTQATRLRITSANQKQDPLLCPGKPARACRRSQPNLDLAKLACPNRAHSRSAGAFHHSLRFAINLWSRLRLIFIIELSKHSYIGEE